MKPTDEERREAAENLRTMCVCGCRYAEQFYELLNETVMDAWDFHDFPDVAYRLADLIEPAPATGSMSNDTTPSMSYITIGNTFLGGGQSVSRPRVEVAEAQ